MTEDTIQQAAQFQPQPQPQPQPDPQPIQQSPQISTVPAIQNVHNYMAIGPQGQLYAYDINLGQWTIAGQQHMEQVMLASGIPPQTLNAIKRVLGTTKF